MRRDHAAVHQGPGRTSYHIICIIGTRYRGRDFPATLAGELKQRKGRDEGSVTDFQRRRYRLFFESSLQLLVKSNCYEWPENRRGRDPCHRAVLNPSPEAIRTRRSHISALVRPQAPAAMRGWGISLWPAAFTAIGWCRRLILPPAFRSLSLSFSLFPQTFYSSFHFSQRSGAEWRTPRTKPREGSKQGRFKNSPRDRDFITFLSPFL